MKKVVVGVKSVAQVNVDNMKVHQYVYAYDFAEWVSENFENHKSGEVYDKLLENDYIEGSLGSRHDYEDSYEGIDQEEQDWFNKFFEEHEILEIKLKYGG